MEESKNMAKTITETIAEQATDALYEAIRVAWQAGYEAALMDATGQELAVKQEEHYLSLVKEQEE